MDCASSKTLKGKITIADRIAKINTINLSSGIGYEV